MISKYKRIYILGPSGSGKSTIAKKISKKLKIPSYDLDDIFWIKKPIKKRKESLFRPRLKKLISKKEWIIEGVFHSWVKDAVEKSNLIILINLSPKTLSWRLFTRYLQRKFKREEDSFKDMLKLIKFSRLYSKQKSNLYQKHQKLIKGRKKQVISIKNRKQLKQFLEDLGK